MCKTHFWPCPHCVVVSVPAEQNESCTLNVVNLRQRCGNTQLNFSRWTFSWAKFKSFRIFDVMTNEVISSRLICLFEKRLWFLMSVTCVQCEPGFICEENGVQRWTCQSCFSLVNSVELQGQALMSCTWSLVLLTVWSKAGTSRSFSRALFLLKQRRSYLSCCCVNALMQPCPALLV